MNSDVGDLHELLCVCDMYNIPMIRDHVVGHLRAHFCHFFTPPHVCDECTSGVLRTLRLCEAHSVQLGNLREECFVWFAKHYLQLFSNRGIAKCSQGMRDTLRDEIMKRIDCSNLIKHMQKCNKLKYTLPAVSWASGVSRIVEELDEHCMRVACNNFGQLVKTPSFDDIVLYNEKNVNSSLEVQVEFLTVLLLLFSIKKICCTI